MTITRPRYAQRSTSTTCPALAAVLRRGLGSELESVCKRYAVTPEEVCSRRRTKNVARARHEFWWRLRNRDGSTFSYVEIGALFGMDHTTILSGVRTIEALQKTTTAVAA